MDTRFDVGRFDIEDYLSSRGIPYKTHGRNISQNFIGICCLFCGDSKYHFGIHKKEKHYFCLRCGKKGNLVSLVSLIDNVSCKKAVDIIVDKAGALSFNIEGDITELIKKALKENDATVSEASKQINDFALPPHCKPLDTLKESNAFDNVFLRYMAKRNFSIETLMEWGIQACLTGAYAMRLLMPILYRGSLVNFLGRDVTGNAEKRYKNSNNDTSPMSTKSLLYGYDDIELGQEQLIVVEGSFDAIRVGKGKAVALLGKAMTTAQLRLLSDINPKELILLFDGDAVDTARRSAYELVPVLDGKITVAKLPEQLDPTEASAYDIAQAIEQRESLLLF